MALRSLPRYFVGRTDAPNAALPAEILAPTHIIDTFLFANRLLAPREWAVAVDVVGNLQAQPYDRLSGASPTLQAELAYHEIAEGARTRVLDVNEFHLFQLQLLEQSAAAPGINDPIYLYGTLCGPFPAPDGQALAAVEGQLTITRADLLEGLVQSAAYAFRYARAAGDAGAPLRCFHLLLPGDREDEIARGGGVILAYPLLPAELIANEASNESVGAQLLHDALAALRADLERENVRHPLRAMKLPVPSRPLLEQQLRAQGYEINGDGAVKRNAGGGLLGSVISALTEERLDLPPEGDIDDLLEITAAALKTLPGWPSPRAVELRRRVHLASPEIIRRAATVRHQSPASAPAQIKIPQPSSPPPPARSEQPAGWVNEFISAHQPPGAPPPRLTTTASATRKTPPREPDWMKDFNQTHTPTRQPQQQTAKSVEPDWLKDFE